MGIVARHTVLAHRGVFPQERPALVGMAGVTEFVRRSLLQHGASLAAVRVMAGAALQLLVLVHRSEKVRRPLIDRFTAIGMARNAQILLRALREHLLCGFWVMLAMAARTADVLAVVRAAAPLLVLTVFRVARQTGRVDLRGRHLRRALNVFWLGRLDVRRAVAMAGFARDRLVLQKRGRLPVREFAVGGHDLAVTPEAALPGRGRRCGLSRRSPLRLRTRRGRGRQGNLARCTWDPLRARARTERQQRDGHIRAQLSENDRLRGPPG